MLTTEQIVASNSAQMEVMHELTGTAASYSRELFQIAVGLGYEFGRLAEAHLAESHQHVVSVMETAVKHLPNGAETIQKAMESYLSNSTQTVGVANKAVAKRRKAA